MAYNTPGDVPAGYMSELQTLRDQWEQYDGYGSPINDWMMKDMANSGVTDIYSMGEWMAAAPGAITNNSTFPWVGFGMSRNEYLTKTNELDQAWTQLTGTAAGNGMAFFRDPLMNGLTAAEAEANWKGNAQLQALYPWIKYGLDYQQFTQQKQSMAKNFGYQLTDTEAAKQLTEFQTNQGTNVSAQIAPTFTQVEKQAAQIGPTGPGSVVR